MLLVIISSSGRGSGRRGGCGWGGGPLEVQRRAWTSARAPGRDGRIVRRARSGCKPTERRRRGRRASAEGPPRSASRCVESVAGARAHLSLARRLRIIRGAARCSALPLARSDRTIALNRGAASMLCRTAAAFTLLMSAALAAPQADDPAKLLPSDTLMYF